jgi:hypothetical protein
MIPSLSWYVPVLFLGTAVLTLGFVVYLLYRTLAVPAGRVGEPWFLLIVSVLLLWLAVQGALSYWGFYRNLGGIPPRIVFALGPPVVLVILVVFISPTQSALGRMPLSTLTYLHVVRVPVEFTLWGLYLHGKVPELMTFAGRNPDILSGLTAPVVAYLCFTRSIWSKKVALAWNFMAVGLLINIVSHAFLSFPFQTQRLAFDQPNVGLLYFPFIWLPGFVVPTVLFAHLVSIKRLWRN